MATYSKSTSISSGSGTKSANITLGINSSTTALIYTVPADKYAMLTGCAITVNSGGAVDCAISVEHCPGSSERIITGDPSRLETVENLPDYSVIGTQRIVIGQLYLGPGAVIRAYAATSLFIGCNLDFYAKIIEFETV